MVTITLLSLIGILSIAASAQSSDRENPTPLTSNTIKGNGTGKKVEYFYTFTAGPGELVVLVDVKAKSGSTGAEIEIFDADASKIFYYYPNATTTNERALKRVGINSKQLVTLRLAFDNNAGEYSLKFGGAFEMPTVATPTEVEASPTSSVSDTQPAVTSEPNSTASNATPAEPSPVKPGKNKLTFGMNILQAVGTQFGLPTSGMLHLVMKDGTTQDVDLSKVKSASVNKQ
jgi:hypothetical protein